MMTRFEPDERHKADDQLERDGLGRPEVPGQRRPEQQGAPRDERPCTTMEADQTVTVLHGDRVAHLLHPLLVQGARVASESFDVRLTS